MAKKKKQSKEERSLPNESVQVIRVSLLFTTRFKEDLAWWFKNNSKKASKILDSVSAVIRDPLQCIGTEPLKYMEADFRSRRIDLEHRLVYLVENEQIVFLACRYHYE